MAYPSSSKPKSWVPEVGLPESNLLKQKKFRYEHNRNYDFEIMFPQ